MTDNYLGEIALFAYAKIPRGWLACNGAELQIKQYNALFAVLGNTYGGDGKTTFRLPDLRGRVPVGYGQISTGGSIYVVGNYAGVEAVALTAANLPPHQHQLIADSTKSVSAAPGRNYFGQVMTSPTDQTSQNLYAPSGSDTIPLNAASVSMEGGNQAHGNVQPYLALAYCIATEGLYPSPP